MGNMENKKNEYLVKMKKPVTFEGKQYEEIDLSCLENIRAADMIAVNRELSNGGNIDVNQEYTLEYALHIASRASGLPIDLFELLRPLPAMRVKRCVSSFLLNQE